MWSTKAETSTMDPCQVLCNSAVCENLMATYVVEVENVVVLNAVHSDVECVL